MVFGGKGLAGMVLMEKIPMLKGKVLHYVSKRNRSPKKKVPGVNIFEKGKGQECLSQNGPERGSLQGKDAGKEGRKEGRSSAGNGERDERNGNGSQFASALFLCLKSLKGCVTTVLREKYNTTKHI